MSLFTEQHRAHVLKGTPVQHARRVEDLDQMVLAEYVRQQLEPAMAYDGTSPPSAVAQEGLADTIFSLVTRGPFRRTALATDTVRDIRSKIAIRIANQEPISFSVPFGAYKNWRLPSYPEPDWAEVFNLKYMCDYVAPIAVSYPPGVAIHYSYTDIVMDIVSNMPRADQARYVETLAKLHALYKCHLPDNCQLHMTRINDLYSTTAELMEELHNNYQHNCQNWEQKYPADVRAHKLRSARHNLMIKGVADLSSLSSAELEARYLDAAMWCDALDCLKRRREFNKYSDSIQLVYVRGPSLSLHIGSCETAGMHFWVGTGVVEVRQQRLLQHIASASAVEAMTASGRIQSFALDTPLVSLSRNFGQVPILDNRDMK